jgi:hypothetical protein
MTERIQQRALDYIKSQVPNHGRYVVQCGKNQSGYWVRYDFDSLTDAALNYKCINTGLGYKKRLVDTKTGEVIARYIS